MKKLALILTCCLFLGGWVSAAPANIATIDLQNVFDDYYKTKIANDRLKERAAEMEKEFAVLREQRLGVEKLYRTALDQSNDQAVSAAAREASKKQAEEKLLELRSLERSMQEFERQATATLKEQERRVRDNILDEIRNAVAAHAKLRRYTLVINTKAESVFSAPVVLYSTEDNDITKIILDQMNANAPAGVVKSGKR